MNPNSRPSILRVFLTDFWAFVAGILPVIFWGFYLFDRFTNAETTPVFLLPAVVATLLGVVIFVWRYLTIASIFEHGVEIEGAIYAISFFRDRGVVSYLYDFQGKRWLTSQRVMKNARTKALTPGDAVTVLVQPDQPKRAIIKALFL